MAERVRSTAGSGSIRSLPQQLGADFLKLLQRRFKVVDNLGGEHIRRRQIFDIFETVILEPEYVQIQLVTFDQLFVAETAEALGFLALVIAADEVVEIPAHERPTR